FLGPYFLHLKALGLPIDQQQVEGDYRRYTGDVNTIGKGEILVHA
ncbi:MAG: formylmethanofuran dehydrogenase subunit C, partial [Anaerolineae bacterium]